MSKPVKNLITESYKRRFEGLTGAVLVDMRGVNALDGNRLRADLAGKDIKVTIVKNSLAKRALAETEVEPMGEMFSGPTAMVYPVSDDASVVSTARELIKWAKDIEKLEFKGAFMEGISFGPEEIDALSKYPTKDEAQATVVQILLTPAQNLVGAVLGPGRKVASLVKTIEEKLEKGEEIKKAS